MMLEDIGGYMKNDILVKVDSMSMATSLEVRSPFLDYRLVEFVLGLPQEYKIKGSVQKRILRDLAKNLVPQSAVERPKHGFSVPVSKWLTSSLKEDFLACLEQAPDEISKTYVRELFEEHCRGGRDHGFKLWSVYVFLIWHSNYRF
jgi:asparagine synthase (glutamine-hydrolysing)